ncbi:cell wall-binding repeat-containing protein [Microaceticoccus formicicus]|uniref:cell wall-binding repeat-containing protein n=1 Tax=Microaceticoccus formicicus TaxID=3118105 RepID=UPI003CD04FE0|nr:cell wall-binding repeat-containing protein [Peptoniphilaceae bacterium AMB_02]
MNKNVRKMLAMMLAFIMVFAAAVPVFADNTDDSNAANNPPILKWVEGEGLWMNFSVNYEKSIARLSSEFIHANDFDTADKEDWVKLEGDADGNFKKLVNNGDFGVQLFCTGALGGEGEVAPEPSDCGLFVTITDKDNGQPRYWRIWLASYDGVNYEIHSEELNEDGTSKIREGWEFDKLDPVHNIQPVKKSQQVDVKQPVKFCVRFQYNDPNAGHDTYSIRTVPLAFIFHVAKGADPKTAPRVSHDVVFVGSDGLFCFEDHIVEGRDYYLAYHINGQYFDTTAEHLEDVLVHRKLFTAETEDKWVNGAWAYEVERDEKGNHTNPHTFIEELIAKELGQFLMRAIGTANQPVRKVHFGVFILDQTDAFHYKKDQNGNLIPKNPGVPFYVTDATNWNGYAGIKKDDIKTHPVTGVVSIKANNGLLAGQWLNLRTGEILGVQAMDNEDYPFPAPGNEDTGYKYNDKVYPLNLWKIKDISRYNEALKGTAVDPKEIYELRDDKVVVTIPFADLFATIRVKIFNAGRTPQVRQPVTGAKVGLYENGNDHIGQEIKLGKELLVKQTDEYGIVEFKGVPVSNVKTFFWPNELLREEQNPAFNVPGRKNLDESFNYGDHVYNNAYMGISMPYLIKQLDTGNHEGLTPYPNIISTRGYFEDHNNSNWTFEDLAITRSDYGFVLDIEIENHADFFGMDNRIAGKNRFDTAVAIAKAQFPKGLTAKDGYKNVVVGEVKTFADALTAGVVAFEYKAPLLMVQGNELPDDTAKYIKANADRVIIVGGFSTVSNKVADEIRDLGVVVKRISGSNRFGTAVEVGEAFRGLIAATNERPAFNLGYDTKSTVFLANAYTFADALTASVPAAYYGIPILLTHQDKLAPETIEALAKWDIEKVIIVGGEKSVSKAVENEIANLGKGYSVERFSGATRQLTSMVLAKTFFEDVTRVFFANGDAFSDALAAAPFGARVKAPIILVEKDKVSDDVVNFLRSNNILEGTIFGGTDQISTAVRDQLANILNLRIEYPGIH